MLALLPSFALAVTHTVAWDLGMNGVYDDFVKRVAEGDVVRFEWPRLAVITSIHNAYQTNDQIFETCSGDIESHAPTRNNCTDDGDTVCSVDILARCGPEDRDRICFCTEGESPECHRNVVCTVGGFGTSAHCLGGQKLRIAWTPAPRGSDALYDADSEPGDDA